MGRATRDWYSSGTGRKMACKWDDGCCLHRALINCPQPRPRHSVILDERPMSWKPCWNSQLTTSERSPNRRQLAHRRSF
ncbi:hypothetical protein IE81DRAFT_86439 [Ceraceosorus guamensis]|uniref:Uncharacterized protein n=1 Tax=Ceraceosorus guamensis TaxID=1522189 RepID=A0A316WG64_9BASI|nr:hypothetical protein IE81DRAFT_86439 [Ceraceosorus guamensis]PWN46185.1 hypothetical protein IE81DRAFT_86439 [Ceraceosorus guamensis]